jgi:hypothetical protein
MLQHITLIAVDFSADELPSYLGVQVIHETSYPGSIFDAYSRGLKHAERERVIFCAKSVTAELDVLAELPALVARVSDELTGIVGMQGYGEVSLHASGEIKLEADAVNPATTGAAVVSPWGFAMCTSDARTMPLLINGATSMDAWSSMVELCVHWALWRRGGLRALSFAQAAKLISGSQHLAWRCSDFLPLTTKAVARWQENYRQLQAFAPMVAAALKSDQGHAARARAAVSAPQINIGQAHLEMAECERQLAAYLPHDYAVFMGVGVGDRVDTACHAPNVKQIVVIEPEVGLLRSALTRFEWHGQIAKRELCFVIPSVQNPPFCEISLRECANAMNATLRTHADWEATGSTTFHEAFFKALLQLEESFTRHSQLLSNVRLRSDKFAFDVTVVSPSCHIFNDVAAIFHRLGLQTRLLNVPDSAEAILASAGMDSMRNLIEQPSKITVFRNRTLLETVNGVQLHDAESYLRGRLVSWWWDVPNVASMSDYQANRPQSPALAFARDILPLLPPGSQWLPPGALSHFVHHEDHNPAQWPIAISFVGQSRLRMLEQNLAMLADILARIDYRFAKEFSKSIGSARGMMAIYHLLETLQGEARLRFTALASAAPRHHYFALYLLSMSVTAAFRLAAIEHLAQSGVPVKVFGDVDWVRAGIIPEHLFKGVIEPDKLPMLYSSSSLNLNLNFMQVSSTVNPKVLDICAAGGAAITDDRPELGVLFPDPNVRPFSFREIAGLPDLINELLRCDLREHRRQIQQHVRANHALEQRVRWLAEHFDLFKRAVRSAA